MDADLLFCLATMLFLAWVTLLKCQIDRLKKEIARHEAQLRRLMEQSTPDVRVGREVHVWGHRPAWFRPP